MYPRTNYEMTEEDLKELLNSCKPTPVMMVGGMNLGASPQENANRAWERLGKKMGFDGKTVEPIQGKGNRFFTAIPSETEFQRKEREQVEAKKAKEEKIKALKEEIELRQNELLELEETV